MKDFLTMIAAFVAANLITEWIIARRARATASGEIGEIDEITQSAKKTPQSFNDCQTLDEINEYLQKGGTIN